MSTVTHPESQLEQLLKNTSKYNRLSVLPTPGSSTTFSVRNQSTPTFRQTNAVNFMDNGNTGAQIQTGFSTNESINTLSITGRRKSATEFTRFVTRARDYYDILVADTNLKNYKSQLVHKYLQNNTSTHYRIINQSCAGVTLVYNPA